MVESVLLMQSLDEDYEAPKPSSGVKYTWELTENLKIEVPEVHWVLFPEEKRPPEVYIEASLWQGRGPLTAITTTTTGRIFPRVPLDGLRARWPQVIVDLGMKISDLPREAHVRFNVFGVYAGESRLLAWTHVQLMNTKGEFLNSVLFLKLWPEDPLSPSGQIIGATDRNESEKDPEIKVHFLLPVGGTVVFGSPRGVSPQSRVTFTTEVSRLTDDLLSRCPILSTTPKTFGPEFLPSNLPAMINLIPWNIQSAILLAQSSIWSNPLPPNSTHVALKLLGYDCPDQQIREYAVTYLSKLENRELLELSVSLIQVLKFEPYLNSPLARLFLLRAKDDPMFAFRLCWHLKTEMEVAKPWFKERYITILRILLQMISPEIKQTFLRQSALVADLVTLNKLVIEAKPGHLHQLFELLLQKLNPEPSFTLPLDPNKPFQAISSKDSRVFGSKQKPLMVFLLLFFFHSFILLFIRLFPPFSSFLARPRYLLAPHIGRFSRQGMISVRILLLWPSSRS